MIAHSVIEFLQCIEEMPVATMYRGQADEAFQLVPSISRYRKMINGYDSMESLESHLLSEFEKYVFPIKDIRDNSQIEKLVFAQHYGLPTRLLDWSVNPLKALFFAVEDTQYDSVDGEVICFSPNEWYEGTKDIKEIDKLIAFYPELLNERVSAQDGCFTAFPLQSSSFEVNELSEENYPSDIEFMWGITIPASSKIGLRVELSHLGVNHRTIYPGLDGVAKWIKSSLSHHRV